jgi:hypothetical protein
MGAFGRLHDARAHAIAIGKCLGINRHAHAPVERYRLLESVVHAPLENEWSVNLHDTIILRGSGMTFNSSTGMPNTSLRDAKISSDTHNIYKHVSIGNRTFAVPRINFEGQQLGMRRGTSERRLVMLHRSPPPRSGSAHARRTVCSSFASHRRALFRE